jgi:hypothetical protein
MRVEPPPRSDPHHGLIPGQGPPFGVALHEIERTTKRPLEWGEAFVVRERR